jgi:acyl-CoA synthetase (AMP-forming)/AMP-acid ligase II
LLYGEQTVRYAELRAAVEAHAAGLLGRGLAKGDRVGLFSENSPFFVAAHLGAIRAGLCVVPFQVDCSGEAFARIVAATGMRQVFVSRRLHERIEPWAGPPGVELLVEPLDPTPAPATPPPLPPIEPKRDLAAVMFTSGSTGPEKGVMVTHHNLAYNTRDVLGYLGLTAADRAMAVLPFCYCYGASLLHTHLMAGASLVLNNRFMFPVKVLDEMVERRCTGLAGVPSTFQILLRKANFARRRFPNLRWLQQAGGKLPNRFLREIRRAMPDVRLFVMYGQTEATARLSYLPPEKLDEKLGAIGRVGRTLPHTRLEVLHADGTPVEPGSDEPGEIVASGENITPGYWDDPEETRRFFRDGKLWTGDLARVDEDGYIFVVERARDFIKAMGNRVGPGEIEEVIADMDEVVEVAVVGVPDDTWGEAVKAYIVPTEPGALTAEDVRRRCLKGLPNYKIPHYVEFLARLPKTAHGKVAKERLKELNTGVRS